MGINEMDLVALPGDLATDVPHGRPLKKSFSPKNVHGNCFSVLP